MKQFVLLLLLFTLESHAEAHVFSYDFKNLNPMEFVAKLRSLSRNKCLGLDIDDNNQKIVIGFPTKVTTFVGLKMQVDGEGFSILIDRNCSTIPGFNPDIVLLNIFKLWDLEKVSKEEACLSMPISQFMSFKNVIYHRFKGMLRNVKSFNLIEIDAFHVVFEVSISPIEDSDKNVGIYIRHLRGDFDKFLEYQQDITLMASSITAISKVQSLREFLERYENGHIPKAEKIDSEEVEIVGSDPNVSLEEILGMDFEVNDMDVDDMLIDSIFEE